jgi:hypothetical protein
MLSLSSALPAFASASLPPIKALACQTAIVGGGAGFSLYFPCPITDGQSFLVNLSSHKGYFQRPEGYYYPVWAKSPRKIQSIWRHDHLQSYHLVRLKVGKLSIIRLRQTADHARRLGLPIV